MQKNKQVNTKKNILELTIGKLSNRSPKLTDVEQSKAGDRFCGELIIWIQQWRNMPKGSKDSRQQLAVQDYRHMDFKARKDNYNNLLWTPVSHRQSLNLTQKSCHRPIFFILLSASF